MIFRASGCMVLSIALLLALQAAAADVQPAGTAQLKYRLIDQFGSPFFCDKDLWPVARPEQPRAEEWFSQADLAGQEFKVISNHLKLEKPADHMQAEDILSLYREHKRLQAITVEGSGSLFTFAIRTGVVGQQGEAISGTISTAGDIKVEQRETVWNTCPKCLAEGTLIDTPDGEIPVQDLRPGTQVWTTDARGNRVAAPVLSVVRTPVPSDHQVMRLRLENGRVLVASPGHPLPDGRSIGEIMPGQSIAGVRVLNVETIRYTADATYDVRPAGPTGFYWAEGVLLATTISR